MNKDIQERTFDFSVRIVNLSAELPDSKAAKVLGNQVLRSGTSIGANVEEASSAYTKDVFAYKINIALSEARETHYWLRLLVASEIVSEPRLQDLIDEANQLVAILTTIIKKTRQNKEGTRVKSER